MRKHTLFVSPLEVRPLLWLAVFSVFALAETAYAQADDENLSADAEAEQKAGKGGESHGRTLAERIPSVTRRVFSKKGRVELTPAVGLALDDPFNDNYIFQGGIAYHISESFAVGAQGEYYASSNSAPDVSGGGGGGGLDFNHPVYAARLELIWSPIYGKVNLFAEEVFHFDTFISAGAGYVGLDQDGGSVAGTIAIGQHYFLNDWLALRWDLRDQIFSMDVNPAGGPGKHVQNLLTFNLGLAFYAGDASPE